MLPIGQGTGQVWLRDQFLCDVEYDISDMLRFARNAQVQRIILTVPEEDCANLLDAYELVLVLADGQQHHIPRPLRHLGDSRLECYVDL